MGISNVQSATEGLHGCMRKGSLCFGVQTAVHVHGNVKEKNSKNSNKCRFGVLKSAVALIFDIRGT